MYVPIAPCAEASLSVFSPHTKSRALHRTLLQHACLAVQLLLPLSQLASEFSSFGRLVVAGSGPGSLLSAIRRQPPNDFMLWHSCELLPMGGEPPAAAALAMAERLVAAYSSRWPANARRAITPERLVTELAARVGDGDALFSPRPALMARVLELMGHPGDAAAAEAALAAALGAAAATLVEESAPDVARLLLTADVENRRPLRRLVDVPLSAERKPRRKLETLFPNTFPCQVYFDELVATLCQAEWPARLMPPFG